MTEIVLIWLKILNKPSHILFAFAHLLLVLNVYEITPTWNSCYKTVSDSVTNYVNEGVYGWQKIFASVHVLVRKPNHNKDINESSVI